MQFAVLPNGRRYYARKFWILKAESHGNRSLGQRFRHGHARLPCYFCFVICPRLHYVDALMHARNSAYARFRAHARAQASQSPFQFELSADAHSAELCTPWIALTPPQLLPRTDFETARIVYTTMGTAGLLLLTLAGMLLNPGNPPPTVPTPDVAVTIDVAAVVPTTARAAWSIT